MKREDLEIGRVYVVVYSGVPQRVRLLSIEKIPGMKRLYASNLPDRTRYHCIKLVTGREVTIKSASRFVRVFQEPKEAIKPVDN